MSIAIFFDGKTPPSEQEIIQTPTCKIVPLHIQHNIKNHLIDEIAQLIEAKETTRIEHMITKYQDFSNPDQQSHLEEKIKTLEENIKSSVNDLKIQQKRIEFEKSNGGIVSTIKDNIESEIQFVEILLEETAFSIFNKATSTFGKIKNRVKHKEHLPPAPEDTKNKIVIYSANHAKLLPGIQVFNNKVGTDINEVKDRCTRYGYNNIAKVIDFWHYAFGPDFLNDVKKNTPFEIHATVHYKKQYNNAFYNGRQIIFGDGNKYFRKFVKFLPIVAHEMFHIVTKKKLHYYGESGALSEHYSDIAGACCEMYTNNISIDDYHWELAPGIIRYENKDYPLRSFKAPGTAYHNTPLGKDPQPIDYNEVDKNYEEDYGGVHLYSGIPNHVFYLVCMNYKKDGNEQEPGWKEPLLFWKKILDDLNNPKITFQEFADLQVNTALSEENEFLANILKDAWKTVGIQTKN